VVPFADIVQAYQRVATGHTRGKIVVEMKD
jgi:hypothetical protein